MMQVYDQKVIRPLFKQLVNDFGSYDAAAALLGVNKGSIAKMVAGDLPIHTHHWCALEDALGRYPITDMLHARVDRGAAATDFERLVMAALREVGDIGPALARALAHGEMDGATKECREAHGALGQLLSLMEGAAQ